MTYLSVFQVKMKYKLKNNYSINFLNLVCMKKLFTLFMATVVAMSMMALPQNVKLAGKKAAPASHEQFEAKTPAQAKVMEMHKAEIATRAFERPASVQKVAPVAPATQHKLAAAEAPDTVKLHFDGFSVEPEYYVDGGDWYFACSDDEYIVRIDFYGPEESYLGTWGIDDIDPAYAYMYTPTDYVEYVDIEFTLSQTVVSQYLTKVNFDAVILGSDGIVYVVDCEHLYLVPKETVAHEIHNATLDFDGMSEFVLAGATDDLTVNLDVYASWPSGRYTKGEFNMDSTSIVWKGVEQELLTAEVVMSVAADTVTGEPGYVGELSFYNQDTILHNVRMVAPLPAPTDTVEIELNNLQVDDSWALWFGWTYLMAANAEWDIYAGVLSDAAMEGEWKGEDIMLYVTDQETYEAVEAVYGEITMVEDSVLGWVVDINAQCTDGKLYVIKMYFKVPEPTVFKTITFENSCAATYYPDLGHDLLLENANDSIEVGVDIYGVPMGGTFTYKEMDHNYSYLVDGYEDVLIGAAEGKIYQVGDTTRMDVVLKGFNAVQYTFNLWYAAPTPTDTVEFTVEDADFVNYIEEQGLYQLYGYAENGIDFISLALVGDEVAGTYVNDGVFSGFGAEGGKYDMYPNYNYVIKVIDPDTEDFEKYTIEKGEVVVTLSEDNVITAKAAVICSNGVFYNITVTAKYNEALQYDAEEPLEVIYTADDVLMLEYDANNEGVWVDIYSADGTNITELLVFVEAPDEETVLPLGTYPIDDSMEYGTVMASPGVQDGYVYPSFYANLTEDGYLSDPLWFMVTGTVVAEKLENGNLKIEINALNSCEQPIHIVYEGAGSGFENVNVETQGISKQIIDGQLVIIRDGKAYNAMGAQVK